MNRSILLAAVAACSLAACDQKTGSTTVTTNAKTGEVTASGDGDAGALHLQPGKWEMKIQVSDLKMADMPKGMGSSPPPATTNVCITPEQAAKGPADILKGAKMDCTATRSTQAGGKLEWEMTCNMPGGGSMTTKTSGTYTTTTLTTEATTNVTGAHAMSQKVHTEGHRIGECDAK